MSQIYGVHGPSQPFEGLGEGGENHLVSIVPNGPSNAHSAQSYLIAMGVGRAIGGTLKHE